MADDDQADRKELDVEFWRSMPGWTVEEAAALLCGLNPDSVSADRIAQGGDTHSKLVRRLQRAVEMGDLEVPARPKKLVRWARDNDLTVDDRLKSAVRWDTTLRNWRDEYMKLREKHKALERECKQLQKKVD